jgi:hypothetical protein
MDSIGEGEQEGRRDSIGEGEQEGRRDRGGSRKGGGTV